MDVLINRSREDATLLLRARLPREACRPIDLTFRIP
jgi:hypothetical protein